MPNNLENRAKSISRIKFIRWMKEPIKIPKYKICKNKKQSYSSLDNKYTKISSSLENFNTKNIQPRIKFPKYDSIKIGCISPEVRNNGSRKNQYLLLDRIFTRDSKMAVIKGGEISSRQGIKSSSFNTFRGTGRGRKLLKSFIQQDGNKIVEPVKDLKVLRSEDRKKFFLMPGEIFQSKRRRQKYFYEDMKMKMGKGHKSISFKHRTKRNKLTGGVKTAYMLYQ